MTDITILVRWVQRPHLVSSELYLHITPTTFVNVQQVVQASDRQCHFCLCIQSVRSQTNLTNLFSFNSTIYFFLATMTYLSMCFYAFLGDPSAQLAFLVQLIYFILFWLLVSYSFFFFGVWVRLWAVENDFFHWITYFWES